MKNLTVSLTTFWSQRNLLSWIFTQWCHRKERSHIESQNLHKKHHHGGKCRHAVETHLYNKAGIVWISLYTCHVISDCHIIIWPCISKSSVGCHWRESLGEISSLIYRLLGWMVPIIVPPMQSRNRATFIICYDFKIKVINDTCVKILGSSSKYFDSAAVV